MTHSALVSRLLGEESNDDVRTSAVSAGVIFFAIGLIKGRITAQPLLASGLETFLIGGGVPGVAYVVADCMRILFGH